MHIIEGAVQNSFTPGTILLKEIIKDMPSNYFIFMLLGVSVLLFFLVIFHIRKKQNKISREETQ